MNRSRLGWIAPELAAEFPELALHLTAVAAGSGRSPAAVRERLRVLSDRFTGGRAVELRQQPVPWAYRVFFRHVGLDPDERRTPVEALALDRMRDGGFRSRNLLDDAITIATVETGVPVIAFDAERVSEDLGLRLAERGERLGGDGRPLSSGQLVVADGERSVAVLFGELADGRGVHPRTRRMLLAAPRVKGVPEACAEEALWLAAGVVSSG